MHDWKPFFESRFSIANTICWLCISNSNYTLNVFFVW